MTVESKAHDLKDKKQKELSPEEQILQRYGIDNKKTEERKARSINELYKLRYQRKIR